MSDETNDGALFDAPSYQEWLNKQNDVLDAEGFAPSAVQRGWRIAGETPLKFFTAVAYRAAYVGTRGYLRRQNRKAIPEHERGKSLYLRPEQMELPDLQAFLIANYDRRLADIRSERQLVEDWCDSHAGYTSSEVYRLAGIRMPSLPRVR